MRLINDIKRDIIERTSTLGTEEFIMFMQELSLWATDKVLEQEFAAEMRMEDEEN